MNNTVEKVFQTLNYKNWLITPKVFLVLSMIDLYLMRKLKHGHMDLLSLSFITNIKITEVV